MERLGRCLRAGKRKLAGLMAVILVISSIGIPVPAMGSEVWPQKSTEPYYCLDGGKAWKASDRYEIYSYSTLPSPLTEVQAKRLFWAYPENWNALKKASAKYDPELYQAIASTVSNPNIVKRVKDDAGTKFAWVADHPEIEARAIAALEQIATENSLTGKEVPEPIREATSEETAASFFVPALCEGPGALNTEFKLSSEFIRDIAKIEAQSVWDNGSTGGNVGWLDASQDKNIAKAVLGEELYEITWSGDSIKIHNNGSAVANENVIGGKLTEEQMYNKTTVRYKITMRKNSGWYTDGTWNPAYLTEWMDFKACVNAPGHQRLYKADIRIVPSDMVFYLVVSQGPVGEIEPRPEYGGGSADVDFQVYRHEEIFESNYNVKLQKVDDETGKPLKGSQFYLYERFEDAGKIGSDEYNGGLSAENLSFTPWEGFQIFSEGTTDEKGEITYSDTRKYTYSKTYCDGHGMPEWAEVKEQEGENVNNEDNGEAGTEEARDQNRKAAEQWLAMFEGCKEASEKHRDTHFHWEIDEDYYDAISEIADSGDAADINGENGANEETAFEYSGCKEDCETTYETFINLRFTYTWKEVQARNGYILHGVHPEDAAVHLVTTVSSEAGAKAYVGKGNSDQIGENVWYAGNRENRKQTQREYVEEEGNSVSLLNRFLGENVLETATDSGARRRMIKFIGSDSNATATDSNSLATGSDAFFKRKTEKAEDDLWDGLDIVGDFAAYIESAKTDGIDHLDFGEKGHLSYADMEDTDRKYWVVRDHRTEGEIHINKRDMDLYQGESEEYLSYGDTEGDATLEGAQYGLFAAEDILHPDSDILSDGTITNTGAVYKKNDLVAVAVTDENGNANFYTYTVAPGMTFDYETEQIVKRTDINWAGPENLYYENFEKNGNWWIGRPLILGSYYVKELSRSEGYELSVNGSSKEWTNYGSSLEMPDSVLGSNGTAVVSLPELTAVMEGEDETGNGYDQLTFTVTSTGTSDELTGVNGYNLVISGFPENTEFYRVDSGEMEVTGPHITGMESVIVTDPLGNTVWKTADSNTSHVKYEPEYDSKGNVIGQIPMSRKELQIQTYEQIPRAENMEFQVLTIDKSEPFWNRSVCESNIDDEESELFAFVKAELENQLYQNGYNVPMTFAGERSGKDMSVFSEGVLVGQTDRFGMTTEVGNPATKTVYGAALQNVIFENVEENTTILQLFESILSWYQEQPHWNFGGIHEIDIEDDAIRVTLYAGVSGLSSRCFFVMNEENGQMKPGSVYTVLENAKTLRWEYQEYQESGAYRYQADKQYFLGSGVDKRYYMDVTLAPAVMMDRNGERQTIEHQVMVYHERGEEIVDYLSGDSEHGYRVPLTDIVDKVEITTETEFVEQDIRLGEVRYDKHTGTYTIPVQTTGEDSFGVNYSDEEQSLKLTFMAKLPKSKKVLDTTDINYLEKANAYGYQAGMEIGYAEYLMRFTDASIGVGYENRISGTDTYIVQKSLVYRGQERVKEDGNTENVPVQVLERPIKQKVKIEKKIEGEEAIGNFRFKIYLKSNLERLYRDKNGEIQWQNKNGESVDVREYKRVFPELVQNFYTKETGIHLLEKIKRTIISADGTETRVDTYNYEKFFDAIAVANKDKWKRKGDIWNTSWKPFVKGLFSGIENEINTSMEAKENAKRSDAVRQFAVDWYLDDEVETLTISGNVEHHRQAKNGDIKYADEIYDKALYQAILKAEEYLKPFFLYDLDFIYGILWDSEGGGGIDHDKSTLAANQILPDHNTAFGISEYLPYGDYVLVEQQPYNAKWNDFVNRHFEIDSPKELSLPQYFDEEGNLEDSSEVSWSITEPGENTEMTGYAAQIVKNKRYFAKLRVEKLDCETGEPILHDGAVFALYRAERNETPNGDGSVKRYETETIISGSKPFLEAMGAKNITSFTRVGEFSSLGAGVLYTGTVSKGTPICREENCIVFRDDQGERRGSFSVVSTEVDLDNPEVLQTTGYLETPEPIEAGVYVLAEIKAPSGYVRSKPIPVEVYSDQVRYYPDGGQESAAAVSFGNMLDENGAETARIYVNDTATSLEVSKIKTPDLYRGMKISGRVEGTLAELDQRYGLDNLQLAYNSSGRYLDFAWKKGTLEYLENRKAAGERVQLVYNAGVFQGYGYVIRELETADDENRYIAGAQLALYRAIAVEKNGDSEDFAFSGVRVQRDRNGAVKRITVKEGEETPVLFYDLSDLEVLQKSPDGELYGFDRNGQKMKITFDTESIYAVRNGQVMFELTGGSFYDLIYSAKDRAFTKLDEDMVIYHLDENKCRDAQVDGYTGLAYVEKSVVGKRGKEEVQYYIWPVTEIKDEKGEVFTREKILTGRPGEKNSGTSQGYLTGTAQGESGVFDKKMNPIVNENGLVVYYPSSSVEYKKGTEVLDRDGEAIGYQYDDLLEEYGLAGYRITEDPEIYGEESLLHRQGEAWIIPNHWVSGTVNPQDPQKQERTFGQADVIRRVPSGTYIMEELVAPDGYVRAMPVAVQVNETVDVQKVTMVNEKTKVEIAKIEASGDNIGEAVEHVELALFKAKRVYTTNYEKYPKGYYLVKEENNPACWYTENNVDNHPVQIEAVWITAKEPKYFEGIPVGDYILEERWTPEGYVSGSMEITIQESAKLQSFIFANDHTKVEVFKYENGQGGQKQPLRWPAEAELTLYPAILDSKGEAVVIDEMYVYENMPIVSWKTGSTEKQEAIINAYEKMQSQYGNEFERFSWNFVYEGFAEEGMAVLLESTSTANNEKVVQYWKLSDSTIFRIVGIAGNKFSSDQGIGMTFSYQFHYQKDINENYPRIVGYETTNGMYRLEYIPAGVYVLVETEVPEGYEKVKPMLVNVEETEVVQRVYLENKKTEEQEKKGKLVIKKVDKDHNEKVLSGSWFEVQNLQDKSCYHIVTGENGCAVLEDLPVYGKYESGVKGPCIYEIREIQSPSGYCLEPKTYRIRFDKMANEPFILYEMTVENQQTEITLSKTDFHTGHFVVGANLALYETKIVDGVFVADGEPIDQWISTTDPHCIRGKLSGGKTYLLIEEKAPKGYSLANPVRFTISADGKRINSITENMSMISISYEEGSDDIKSVNIVGRVGKEIRQQTSDEDGKWIISEWLVFSDGSEILLERETFGKKPGSRTRSKQSNSYPVGTEYCLLSSEGVRIARWDVSTDSLSHEIFNEENREGRLLFETGKEYFLEEEILLNDGTRVMTGKMRIQLGTGKEHAKVFLLNRETDVRIKKTDFVTGKELPGAKLVLKNTDGEVVDTWISGEEEHIIKGNLSPGETYILSETMSTEGYAYAEEIQFTVHEKGIMERVIMEDRPTQVQIRKIDMVTGEELEGAKLILKDANGVIVDQWISGKQAHWIKGRLIAGNEYTLIEEMAPQGYLVAEEVTFTVSMNGTIDRVVMEDQREMPNETPEDSNEPNETTTEEVPTTPETNPASDIPEEPKKIGYIIAHYKPELKQPGTVKVLQPTELEYAIMPQTGEEGDNLLPIVGMLISMFGLGVLERDRRKRHEKQSR